MKIVLICWLHTGDPDVQESQACPQTQYHRPCGPMTWKHGLHKLKHSSHYGTLPMKQPNSTMLSPYSQLTWHPRCPPSSEVHPATILTHL